MPRGIPGKPTELCPFCGQLFTTGILRGRHIRAVHWTALSEILADCDQAGLDERLLSEAAEDDRKLHATLKEGIG